MSCDGTFELSYTYGTYGNYGQFSRSADSIFVNGEFVDARDWPGAVIDDRSHASRKNRNDDVKSTVTLAEGTIVRTEKSSASSANHHESTDYRVVCGGQLVDVEHKARTRNEPREAVTSHEMTLPDGSILTIEVGRRPRFGKGVRTNSYAGTCRACGGTVAPERGVLEKIEGKWTTTCAACHWKAEDEIKARLDKVAAADLGAELP